MNRVNKMGFFIKLKLNLKLNKQLKVDENK